MLLGTLSPYRRKLISQEHKTESSSIEHTSLKFIRRWKLGNTNSIIKLKALPSLVREQSLSLGVQLFRAAKESFRR